jgi:ABC-type transport system involved in multi-copper enzyme maturation permease subunit
MHAALTLARYTIVEALHGRIAIAAAVLIAGAVGLGQFVVELALTDTAAIRALSLAWLFRVAAVFLVAGFAASSVVRDHNEKHLELLLALPTPRTSYLLGKWLGCVAASMMLALMFSLPLAFDMPWRGVAAWAVSLGLELIVIAGASLLCALTFQQLVASLAAVAAFYMLSRVMGAVLAIGASAVAPVDSVAFDWSNHILHGISMLLPRLDLFTRSQWLVDGAAPAQDLVLVGVQAVTTSALLLLAAMIDLTRKSV